MWTLKAMGKVRVSMTLTFFPLRRKSIKIFVYFFKKWIYIIRKHFSLCERSAGRNGRRSGKRPFVVIGKAW